MGMSQREQINYYEILEISPDAATSEINKAYQRARQTYSADNPALYSMFSPEEATELLRLIDEAYNVLGNQSTRKSYDEARQAAMGSRGGAQGTSAAPVSQTKTAAVPAASVPSMASAAHLPDELSEKRTKLSQAIAMPGQGRTQLSTYKFDETFENEIASAAEFDGGFIQRVRLYKNVSIDKMSEATRISRTYLMAVETNDFKSLPAAVFVRGFIVQVARQLGLDEPRVAASYMKLFKAGGGK